MKRLIAFTMSLAVNAAVLFAWGVGLRVDLAAPAGTVEVSEARPVGSVPVRVAAADDRE
jgi:hypothetical protein